MEEYNNNMRKELRWGETHPKYILAALSFPITSAIIDQPLHLESDNT